MSAASINSMPRVRQKPWTASTTGLLADAAVEAERIDGALGEQRLAARDGGADLGEVEAGGEVIAVGEHDGAAQLRIVLEPGEGLRQLPQHGEVEGVALGGAVEADHPHVAVCLGRDPAVRGHAREHTPRDGAAGGGSCPKGHGGKDRRLDDGSSGGLGGSKAGIVAAWPTSRPETR